MKRVVKFRGKDRISGEMVFGDLIHGVDFKKGNYYILPNTKNLAYVKNCDPLDGVLVEPESVGQYTGLKDKNGVEIYKGDIIECDGERYEVFWCDDMLSWQCISKDDCLALHEFKGDAFIIGNLHTNPELLEQ